MLTSRARNSHPIPINILVDSCNLRKPCGFDPKLIAGLAVKQ
jgi:hypothetical protein